MRHDSYLHRSRCFNSVTVVEVTANRISQIKTQDTDGYQAIQVTTGERRDSRVNAAQKVTCKAGVVAGRGTWEFLRRRQRT